MIVSLTKGYVTVIDDEDWPRISKYKWVAHVENRGYVYAVTNVWRKKKQKTIRLQRLLMNCKEHDGKKVDHIDHDTLNNRKVNLRVATTKENAYNQKMLSTNTSGYKGVSYVRKLKKYRTMLSINGKNQSVGLFVDPLEAAKAYDKAALLHYGQFALTNKMLNLY